MDIDKRLEEIDAQINARIAKIDERIDARIAEIDESLGVGADQRSARPAPAAHAAAASGTRAAVASPQVAAAVCSPATPSRVRAAIRAIAGVKEAEDLDPMEVAYLWSTSEAELQQLMAYVCTSPHVTSNPSYAKVAEDLLFVIAKEDPTINAFATLGEYAQAPGIPADAPMIYLLNGAILYAKLISAAFVASRLMLDSDPSMENPMPIFVTLIGNWVVENRCEITEAGVADFAGQLGLHYLFANSGLYRKVSSFASAVIICILAHEFGHLSLGHVHGVSVNLEVSRNQEREADSFASSVISSGPFGGYMVLGTVLWELVWVWLETVTGEPATTHPLSSERLADLIRANPSAAAELGLSAPEDVQALGLAAKSPVRAGGFKWGVWNRKVGAR